MRSRGPSWASAPSRAGPLPPATAPASLARALGQGVLHGRLPQGANGARGAGASPLPVEQMQHEGQRSVAELGAILWHAMEGKRDAPELAPWMIPPHADPIVALSLSRGQITEYAARDAVDRTCAFPGDRVWLVEIERAKGDTPAGIAVWRSRGANGEWRTRCACVWTHGRIGSATHPLVIGAQWDVHGDNAAAGACVIGPNWDDATRAAADASRNAVLARRQNAIGKQMIARIVVPAALAWLDAHAGNARPAGHVGEGGAQEPAEQASCRPPSRIVVPVPGAARTPAPAWLTADVERAVEAIVIGAAREGYRIGRELPRRGVAARLGRLRRDGRRRLARDRRSEGADRRRDVARDGAGARRRQPRGAERPPGARRDERLGAQDAHPDRAEPRRARTDARTLCALEIPRRLWRALGEAGPRPAVLAAPQLSERWWIVEIEAPADDEPNAIALWEADGAEVALAGFLCPGERGGAPFVTVVTWRTSAEGERSSAGLAALRAPVHADDPDNPESRAGLEQIIEALAAPGHRADRTGEDRHRAAPRKQRTGAGTSKLPPERRQCARTRRRCGRKAPEVDHRALRDRAGAGARDGRGPREGKGHGRGGGGQLEERQRVRAHFKRQAFGPRLSRRRLIVIEGYRRGPAPEEDQIVVTRLAEGELRAGRNTRERRRHKRRRRSGRTL